MNQRMLMHVMKSCHELNSIYKTVRIKNIVEARQAKIDALSICRQLAIIRSPVNQFMASSGLGDVFVPRLTVDLIKLRHSLENLDLELIDKWLEFKGDRWGLKSNKK